MGSRIRLVAFDLDGTLTRGPTCLEAAATAYGFVDRLPGWQRSRTEAETAAARVQAWRELTERSGAGVDQGRALAAVSLAPGAVEGVAALHGAGISTVIVSLAFAPHVAHFARRLGVDSWIATEPGVDGPFRHVFSRTKPTLLAGYVHRLGLTPDQVAAVGDTPGDLPMLRSVGTSVYVGPEPLAGFTPTLHLPAAAIDQLARRLLDRPG